MISIALEAIHAVAGQRKPGYVDACLQTGRVDGDRVFFTQEQFDAIRRDYALPAGPGTELKRLLSWFGIDAQSGCQCDARALEMDLRGPDWCRSNVETIIGWLREEAERRGIPFSERGAALIVSRSIRRAEKQLKRSLTRG